MGGHAVGHCAHHVLAHAAMHIGSGAVSGGERREAALVAGGRFQVGAAHHALGQHRREPVVDLCGDEDAAGGRRRLQRLLLIGLQHLLPAGGQIPAHHALEFHAFVNGQGGDAILPRPVRLGTALARGAPGPRNVGRHFEGAMRPPQEFACRLRVLEEQPTAVPASLPLQARDTPGDDRAAGDERRARVLARRAQRRRYRLHVMAVDFHHMPLRHAKALRHVLADGQLGAAVVGDAVVVPQEDQLAQTQVAGQRNHFLAHTFLQAAVAYEGIRMVVHQPAAEAGVQVGLGHRHAEGVRDPLAQRAGGDFDAVGRSVRTLRVALTDRAQLAKAADLLDRKLRVAGQVQQGVHQHGAVTVGQHHPVAVEPARVLRVELQVARVQRGGDLGHPQRHALVALLGLHDGVDREKADGVGEGLLGMRGHGSFGPRGRVLQGLRPQARRITPGAAILTAARARDKRRNFSLR